MFSFCKKKQQQQQHVSRGMYAAAIYDYQAPHACRLSHKPAVHCCCQHSCMLHPSARQLL
jgi:hypothetical protein